MLRKKKPFHTKPAREFSVCAIRILDKCSDDIRKVLKEEWYLLNGRCYVDGKTNSLKVSNNDKMRGFFGSGISLCAIVGMNGSGKSSLFELMYRIVNNLACLLIRGKRRRAAEEMYYVDGLWAELYYTVDGRVGVISCQGDTVFFKDNTGRIVDLHAFEGLKPSDETVLMEDFIRWAKECLFYTIVTNYSMQAFCSQDYSDEPCFILDNKRMRQPVEDRIWIDGLFHKNDGYMSPIVLNSYRDGGTIDMAKEHGLTKYRLSAAMLFAEKRGRDFMKDYKLDSIIYKFDKDALYKKYIEKARISENVYWSYKPGKNPRLDFGTVILCAYGAERLDYSDTISRATALYLIYKTYSIANCYPSYNEFAEIGNVNRLTEETNTDTQQLAENLVERIKKDKSHITLKIRQTLHFMDALKDGRIDTQKILTDSFDYNDYIQMIAPKDRLKSMSSIQEYLPPSFFTIDIRLNHYKRGRKTNENPVSIGRLSSGERQYLYTFSTYIYHILNLLSIQESYRVKYRRFNLVFDEVEICFHPEYQRRFIDELLGYIRRMRLNVHATYNIIIATHSPFILSDIPQINILYLDDGKTCKHKPKNPFVANISDILYESFFLSNGFVGEWARNKINKVLQKGGPWEQLPEEDKMAIEEIGDEFLKKQLKRSFDIIER